MSRFQSRARAAPVAGGVFIRARSCLPEQRKVYWRSIAPTRSWPCGYAGLTCRRAGVR